MSLYYTTCGILDGELYALYFEPIQCLLTRDTLEGVQGNMCLDRELCYYSTLVYT